MGSSGASSRKPVVLAGRAAFVGIVEASMDKLYEAIVDVL